jgi:hypothetical protein
MYTHKQERTNREEGLENIIESMYTPTSEGRLSQTTYQNLIDCEHCNGTGKHGEKDCEVCDGTGKVAHKKPNPDGATVHHYPADKKPLKEDDYVPPHDEDKLKRAKKRGFDNDIDHHNQYMMNQDLLQPIHQAASIATDGEAKNFNEWLIIQIKDQGDHWVDWFIETVIVEERFRD